MGQKQPSVDIVDEVDLQSKQKSFLNDVMTNKQQELLKASKNQHFKETEKDMEKMKEGKNDKKKKKSNEENEEKIEKPLKQVKKSKNYVSTQEENFNIEDMK
jgi:hypothetical protein